MSGSNTQVSITVQDEIGIISVLDGQLNNIKSDFGFLQLDLPPGLYKAVCRVGREVQDQIFSLPQDQAVKIEFGALDKNNADVLLAEGLKLAQPEAMMTLTPNGKASDSVLLIGFSGFDNQNPLPDLSFWSADNKLLAGFEQLTRHDKSETKVRFVQVNLAPGNYLLKAGYGTALVVSRAILLPTSGGSLFITRPNADSTAHQALINATYYANSHLPIQHWPAAWFKLSRLVSDSLQRQKNLSHKNERILMLDEKCENPILGVFVAYLMLLDTQPNFSLLSTVIGNLEHYLGDARHPDLVALKLKFNRLRPKQQSAYAIEQVEFPPLLNASWKILVEEANTRPEIFADSSICWEIMDRIISSDLWLVWRTMTVETPEQQDKSGFDEAIQVLSPTIKKLASDFGLLPGQGLYSEHHSNNLLGEETDFFRHIDTALPRFLTTGPTQPANQPQPSPGAHKKPSQQKLASNLLALISQVPWDKVIGYLEMTDKAQTIQLTPLQEKLLACVAQLKPLLSQGGVLPADYWQYLRKELAVTEPYLVDNAIDLVTKAKLLLSARQQEDEPDR